MPGMLLNNARMRSKAIASAAGTLLALSALAGCSAAPAPVSQAEPTKIDAAQAGGFLKELGLEGLDAKAAIDRLDRLPVEQRPAGFTASVQPSQLVIADTAGRTTSLPMPEDQFYLSAAPYVNQTHSCHFHSLTTCLGELSGENVQVKALNADTGEVLVDRTIQSFDNGFLGLWVPRGINVELTFSYEGKTASSTVSTAGSEVATCLTELRLV